MSDRRIARLAGVLFIVATVAAIVGGSLLLPAEEPRAVVGAVSDDARIITGFLVELVLVWSVVGIATTLFPVLRRTDEGLALGYVAARMIEGVLLLAAAVSPLLVLALSRDGGPAGVAGAAGLGDLLTTARDWTYLVGSVVAFGASAVILYSLLYRARLVPVWLSLWGLAGAVLIVLRGVVELYGVDLSGAVQGALAAPIALNEMVLAVWLIVRGFSSRAPSGDREQRQVALSH